MEKLHRLEISCIYCVLYLLLNAQALPLTLKDEPAVGLKLSRSDDSSPAEDGTGSSQDLKSLTQRKTILEEMLRDTNTKISQLDEDGNPKRANGFPLNVVSRMFEHGPLMDPPTKKSRTRRPRPHPRELANDLEITTSLSPPTQPTEENLKLMLAKLTQRLRELEGEADSPDTTSKTTTTTLSAIVNDEPETLSMSIISLYDKLADIDIDIHKLLGTNGHDFYQKEKFQS